MKKLLFIVLLIFHFAILSAQKPQWGSWSPVSCYSRLSTSVLGNGYVPSIKEYSWQVRIKSSYAKKVTFNMTWVVGGERLSIGQVTLEPGESYGHTPRYFKSSSNNISILVSEVCFEGQDCYKNGYADCNGNQVKVTSNNTTSPTTYSSSTTQTNSRTSPQKNDPTEYNRSKADLERQMNEKNGEIQRQNQENTNKLNIWNNAIKAGVDAHNKGNYVDAKNQFSIAINNSTNEINRINAQNYYNKSVDADKSQSRIQTANTVGKVVTDLAKNIKIREWDNGNLVGDNNLFNDFTKDVIIELEKAGLKYSHLDNLSEEKFISSTETNANVIDRVRKLYFYYDDQYLINASIRCRYISLGNGTYFYIKLDYNDNNKIADLLKSNNPFKKFKSAYSNRKYDYMGKDMISYTNRVNQFDVEIFKQENLGENNFSKIETSINEPTMSVKICEQRLKTVIDGFNSFNNCNQRAEMNLLLKIATKVAQDCPSYYIQNQGKVDSAMRRVEKVYKDLGCNNN